MSVVTVFEQQAQEYDEWFDAHQPVYQAEIAALQKFVSTTGLGIEVSVGTGALPFLLASDLESIRAATC